ncbi:MAG: ABC transporter permease [Candidatus Dormiibacterota bacterium]
MPTRPRHVLRRLGIGRIALRMLRSRPAPAIAEGLILAAAATLVASVVLIQSDITDRGLRTTIVTAGTQANVIIEQDGIAQPAAYDAFQRLAAERVHAQLGNTVTPGAQFGVSKTLSAQTLDCTVEGPPVKCKLSVATYAGIGDHAHIVTGRWATDARDGSDWEFTASAQATDQSGITLHLAVGTEYCFQNFAVRSNAPQIWCGQLVGTWLPNSVSDPYWAGNVPDSDVIVTHNSFFQILAQIPDAVGAADQQYSPKTATIHASDAHGIVSGINRLRGYSLSSNGVFVSALDSTVSGFLARQDASSGPILVTTLGLLVIALTAMGFAAVHLLESHVAQVALWRARGWSRVRIWGLYSTEFAVLAVVAVPFAVVASAAISSAAAGASTKSTMSIWQRLAGASIPTAVAESAFLAVLIVVAATFSGPELSSRRQTRTTTRGRSPQRRALDIAFMAIGVGILWFVRQGGVGTDEAQSSVLAFVLSALAVALIASPSLRLVGLVGRVLTVTRAVGGRLARWEIERDPGQYSRLSLLVMLAVAVSVFATTYISSDNAGAIDRADYQVGADMRATFATTGGPPQVAPLAAALPSAVRTAQVFRDTGRPGQTGLEATVLGIQGTGFWNIAFSRPDFASQPVRSLTDRMNAADPDGARVPGSPHALMLSVDSSGVSARIALQISDAAGDVRDVPLGTAETPGWSDLTASLTNVSFPIRVRALTISPTDVGVAGDVAIRNLRTDGGAVIESFDVTNGWWQEAFAPNPAALPVTPTFARTDEGQPSVDIPVDNEEVLVMPPASSRPLPVLIASQSMSDLGLTIGQPFPIHVETVNVELVAVGTFDEFPTYYPGSQDFLVLPMSSLLNRMGRLGVVSPWANELWMRVPSADAAAVTSKVNSDLTLLNTQLLTDAQARATALNDPLRSGFAQELGIGALIALLVVVINFAMHFLAAARNRTTQYAIMRASGVPQSTLRNALVGEQVAVLISGLVTGTAIGLAVAWAVLPVFHLGNLPTDLIPPSLFRIDPLTLIGVVLGTGALSLLTGIVVAGRAAHVHVMTTIRTLA